MPWGGLRTLCCGSKCYDFARDQVVTPAEELGLQGLPCEALKLDGFRPSAISKLAGQGMFLPNIGLVLLAYTANPFAPWWNGN
jgi:hypothetical protein